MDKQVRYSAVPVGEFFKFDELMFKKSSVGRAKLCGYNAFKRIKKHQIVEWINAWDTQIN